MLTILPAADIAALIEDCSRKLSWSPKLLFLGAGEFQKRNQTDSKGRRMVRQIQPGGKWLAKGTADVPGEEKK